jgi:hypothetical protein
MDDRAALANVGQELFGTHSDIPPVYLRQLQHHLETATAKLGLVVNDQHVAYWIDGRSLGFLGCTGIDDKGLDNIGKDVNNIGGAICQLDQVTTVDLKVAVQHDEVTNVASAGRIVRVGIQGKPGVVLDATPGRFSTEKRAEVEHFIDQLLAALAGRA